MALSDCGSYRKATYDYDEYIAIHYVFNKLESGKTAFDY